LFPPHASVFLPSFGQFCSGEDDFERGGRKTNELVSWYFMYYEIWWEGKIGKKYQTKAYFWWIESVLASHGPYL
jgi:hypothetical protein